MLVLGFSLPGTAGAGARPDELAPTHTETARVRMVLLEASVTDRRGRVVRGLESDDFRVLEDGVPQKIAFFAAGSDEPLSVAFLLDVSGSMDARLQAAKHAVRSLVYGLRDADRFALACFADEQVVWATEFTQDRKAFLAQLDALDPSGRSAIVDALAAAPGLVDERVATRKAIVLITDGTDNASQTPTIRAVELARRVNVPVFTIALLPVDPAALPEDSRERTTSLDAVSDVTGGRVWAVHGDEELSEALELLRDELRFQYLFGYYVQDAAPPGKFQAIRLEVRRGLEARTRSGYYTRP